MKTFLISLSYLWYYRINKMGVDCSCLKEGGLSNEEMDMSRRTKAPLKQETGNYDEKAAIIIQDNNRNLKEDVKEEEEEDSIIKVHPQINAKEENLEVSNDELQQQPDAKQKVSRDDVCIQSAARGYLVRKEIAASKNVKRLDPTKIYTPFTDSLSSKIAKTVRKLEKELGKYKPQAPEDDHENVAHFAAVELEDGSIYEGEWNELGEKHGLGVEIGQDGSKYVGYFKNNKKAGNGRFISADGELYEGEFKRGQPSGNGVLQKPDGSRYEGSFRNGTPYGKGKEKLEDGSIFEGEFKNGQKNGTGIIRWENGNVFEGEFKNDIIEGYGVFTWAEGKKYEGEWKDSLMHGHGVLTWPNGQVYDGEFKEGKQDGEGTQTFENKKTKTFETRRGIWKNGNRTEWLKEKSKKKE
ncbi:unnamed protein product [Blepharisma stoltei]|uniref:MORN repeat protein n=1 Tax=Blepharisma stoltei TaxID=1481888 RepID=A0AAU9K1M3_9CILI|nr:unnamed protein product [Blepharisma stoltei]